MPHTYTAGTVTTANAGAAVATPPAFDYVSLLNTSASDAEWRLDGGDWVTLRAGGTFEREVTASSVLEVRSAAADTPASVDYFVD